ncbi:ribbon-helix-helix protein, CopG family [Vibrio harveyi]|nr:ribbon-helix-helix protein, CopG family [Vibrio harveyi]
MATTKTATLTIRVEPNLKEAIRTAAQAEHRSIANMIEVMIREHCEKKGIAIDNAQELDQRQELKK